MSGTHTMGDVAVRRTSPVALWVVLAREIVDGVALGELERETSEKETSEKRKGR